MLTIILSGICGLLLGFIVGMFFTAWIYVAADRADKGTIAKGAKVTFRTPN